MAKIAVEIEPTAAGGAGGGGRLVRRILGAGKGWSVSDVICGAGPRDRSFEEQHSNFRIAMVLRGSFQYRSSAGRELMTPGSLLLGNGGQYFQCGHEHGVGDRCIAFAYEPEYFDAIAAEAEIKTRSSGFALLRLPPVRELSSLITRAYARLTRRQRANEGSGINDIGHWEEIAIELVGRTLEMAASGRPNAGNPASAEARVTRAIRMIESHPAWHHELASLAREAKLSRYHFLRTFQALTGLTPHRYILRMRIRNAAVRLIGESAPVLDVALDTGFGDVSNFNHAFRAEFDMSPRECRKAYSHERVLTAS